MVNVTRLLEHLDVSPLESFSQQGVFKDVQQFMIVGGCFAVPLSGEPLFMVASALRHIESAHEHFDRPAATRFDTVSRIAISSIESGAGYDNGSKIFVQKVQSSGKTSTLPFIGFSKL